MKSFWFWWTLTVVAMAVEAIVSYGEGTFWRSQGKVRMTFLWNLSVSVGGFIIMPIVNGLIGPRMVALWFMHIPAIIYGFSIGFFVTMTSYYLWWKQGDPNRGHILYWEEQKKIRFPYSGLAQQKGDSWAKTITWAGWIHFVCMVVQIAALVVYLAMPMAGTTVFGVGVLLIILSVVATLQAEYIQKGISWPLFFGELVTVLIITVAKMR